MRILMTFLCLSFSAGLFAQQTFIAHRGASYLAPENTVASANLAWELNADAVEIDVYLTKDNRVMVMHDKSTKRTSGGKTDFVMKDTPSSVLRGTEVGSWKGEKYAGEKIPFISEVIETVPKGKDLVVEIKCGSEVLPFLKKEIEKSGKLEQMIFICFGWETILDTKKEFPNNACYWLSSTKQGLREKMKDAAHAGLEGVNLSYRIIDEEVMQMAKEFNLEVLTWTVDDPEVAKRLTSLGVTAITTNRPQWLKKEMGM
ncbi:glycerophosphoryl diester phosphodiesterase [Mariniphaga anaerophila]|uniref:Glycerophosphoryl diester phosphodiesterase n=1 Tax=Mariniphaga anaerophila TaxID=1484053 RepID=A0A1M5FXN2_9BACT|nr:glycerophosphodiester phosphodiesterase family protein [Mariniphaga anaerophila]SHF95932.1 glycerophosphoryl diester phosphodiesterase [Mariniphaga anaerophila]